MRVSDTEHNFSKSKSSTCLLIVSKYGHWIWRLFAGGPKNIFNVKKSNKLYVKWLRLCLIQKLTRNFIFGSITFWYFSFITLGHSKNFRIFIFIQINLYYLFTNSKLINNNTYIHNFFNTYYLQGEDKYV